MTEAEQRKLNTIRQNVPKVYDAGHTKGFAEGEAVGKEVGYADGYSAGETEGREAGYVDGKQSGYTEGYSVGKSDGQEAGYAEGYTKGETAGKEVGRTEGYSDGYSAGEAAGIKEGKQQGRDAWMRDYQGNGSRTDCDQMFAGQGWNEYNITPIFSITPTRSQYMFRRCAFHGDLAEHFKRLGITIDFSKSQYVNELFVYCQAITGVPTIDLSSIVDTNVNLFQGNSKMESVEKIVARDVISFGGSFTGCTALVHLLIEGTLGKNGFNVQECPLNHDSLMSILNALKDYSADTSGTAWIVTIGEANRAKLTEEELYIAEAKGWEVK